MRRHLHAEWTKLRTTAGTGWLLLGIVALTVGVSAGAATTMTCPPSGCAFDVPKVSLIGVQLGQAVVAILAVLAVSGEYSTGMIHTTLTAMPRRVTVLAAKAVLVAGLTLVAGAVAVLWSLLAAQLILPPGSLSLTDGPTLRAAVGSVLYLVLVALLSLGITVAVRDSAVAVGAVLGVLYLLSFVAYQAGDPDVQRLLYRISPMNAGLTIQATTNLSVLPIGPWAGLGVLAAWAAAALVGGGLLLQRRDA